MGNTRVAFKAENGQLLKTAETAFGPWGVRLNGIGSVNGFQNRWELQGKEREQTFGLNRVNFGARVYNPTIGRFDRIDPLAEIFSGISGYNYASNNPINRIDPDGNADFGVNDWIKFADGSVSYDASVNNQAQATAKYGSGATDLGKSATLTNGLGQTVSLNANGTATNAIPLNEVTVMAKASEGGAIGALNDAIGLSNDTHAGVLAGVQMLDKTGDAAEGFATVGKALDAVGKFSGITGAIVSAKDAYDNPSFGNVSKLVLDIGLVGVKSTTVGLIDGVLSVTGLKDSGFKYIDSQIDTFKYNQAINSQMLESTKFKIK